MRGYELRPMSVGEILDGSVSIYRECFATLVTIAIVCLGIPTLMQVYVALSGNSLSFLDLFALMLWSFGSFVSSAATLWVVSETYLGRSATASEALRFAFGKFGALFITGLGVGLVVMLGLLLLIVPGVIAACGYAVTSQVVVLESVSADVAMKRSWHLTKGFKGKVFGLGCVAFLIVLLPSLALGMVAALLPGGEGTATALGDFVALAVTPLFTSAFTLLYYDLRVRKEAFDLEMLTQQLGGTQPATT